MRAPKNNTQLHRERTYVLVDGKYSYLGSTVFQDTDTTSEYLTHYIRQRKEAKHVSSGLAASGKKSYQAWWDGL
jgi:hypothetical protein